MSEKDVKSAHKPRTRKRIIDEEQWVKNIEKKNRYKPSSPPLMPKCKHNNKRFQCSQLVKGDIKAYYDLLYLEHDRKYQNAVLLKMIKTVQVDRHRAKKGAATQMTCRYFIQKKSSKALIPVCLQTFLDVTQVSRFRINLLTKKEFHNESLKERRGGFKNQTKFEKQTESISEFLRSLKFVEVHYCRSETERKYLPSDLNISRLYKMYIDKQNDEELKQTKESYFRMIFNTKFNIGFGSPRSDVCSTCESYNERLKVAKDSTEKLNLQVGLAIHKKRAKAFFQFLKSPSAERDESEILDDTAVLSFDCQKNLQLLKVPDSSAYYSRNVYLYNFTVVCGYSSSSLTPENVTSYCWTENQFPKNANTIASCLLYHLSNINLCFVKRIRLVSDGCAGQNKNSILVTALISWLHLSAPPNIEEIELIFPVTGHSYIPPDRVFAQIENRARRLDTIISPNDYLQIIREYATVKQLGLDLQVLDVKKTMGCVMKPCSSWNFNISQIKRLYIAKKPSTITLKGEMFYLHDSGTAMASLCKRGKRLSHLTFDAIEETNVLDSKKKKDLQKLITSHFGKQWRNLQHLSFFLHLLGPNVANDEELENEDDPDDPPTRECSMLPDLADLIV